MIKIFGGMEARQKKKTSSKSGPDSTKFLSTGSSSIDSIKHNFCHFLSCVILIRQFVQIFYDKTIKSPHNINLFTGN